MESAQPQVNDIHVLVIGAAATGLLLAHGLQKAGIKCSVFEYEPSAETYRPREWTMGIHWGIPLLESLLPEHLRARWNEAYVDPSMDFTRPENTRMRIYNGLNGEVLKDIPLPGKLVRVSRRKLRAFLAQEVDVKYDHKLVDIKYDNDGVTAIFANGNKAKGTLIVGCDGPKSAVRSLLLGEERAAVTPLDIAHANTAFCLNDAEKAKYLRSFHPVWAMCMHPDCFSFWSIQDTVDPDKPETWRFQVCTGWLGERDKSEDSAAKVAEVKRKGAQLPEPFKSAIQWIPDDYPMTYDQINYWDCIPWDTHGGRVTLAGDAAHPMPPHRGQGLNNGIQDVYNLVSLLTSQTSAFSTPGGTTNGTANGETEAPNAPSPDLATAIQAYSDEVAKRGGAEVETSRHNAFMTLDWEKLKESPLFKHALNKMPVAASNGDANGDADGDFKGDAEAGGEAAKQKEVERAMEGVKMEDGHGPEKLKAVIGA